MPRKPPIRTSARPQRDIVFDAVRARMDAADRVQPGARLAIERFFAALAARGETVEAASQATFDVAAKSEPTLATLIRALGAYAPEVNLAAAREARRDWYRKRPKTGPARRRGRAPLPATVPADWPAAWAALWPGVMAADISEGSRRRYFNSVSRLAQFQAPLGRFEWSRFDGWRLMDACQRAGLSSVNIGNLLGHLAAAGKLGGAYGDQLAGVREMAEWMRDKARRRTKKKVGRLEDLTERGGLMAVAEVIALLREEAARPPIWTACAARVRAAAAVLALELESWARRGDVAGWMLGEHLVRRPSGVWSLRWTQGKTGDGRDVGDLQPEIGEVLDELLLAGRPAQLAHRRYVELVGCNFLTLESRPSDVRLPSELVMETLGVPIHDLRTLLADTLRGLSAARARELIATALGHRDLRAQDEYAAVCAGDAAAGEWAGIRAEYASGRRAAA